MAGKRILLAAEMSRGAATTVRLLPLAAELADRGHDVTLALPLGVDGAGFPVSQAPGWTVPPPPGFVAASYADLLLMGGYATVESLRGLLAGWRSMFQQVRPELLIADFAPTAMLVARTDRLDTAALGDGYSLPPLTAPMPVMRPWADIRPDAAADAEGRILAVVNVLQPRPLRHLRDLFGGIPSFLCAFPELDHYPGRADGACFGQVFPPSCGPTPTWPDAQGQRVYVDLDPRHPALAGIVAALEALGLPALLQGAAMPEAVRAQLVRPQVEVTDTGNRTALMTGCDFVVCQSMETAGPALLAGKPLLMLPVFTEQMMTLHRVATQGLGHGVPADADTAVIEAAIRRLADDRDCQLRAANYARLYDGYRPGLAIGAIADEIDGG
jgi:hypothetical protein